MTKKRIYDLLLNSSIGQKITNSPKALELFKGSFWSIIGAIFSKGLIFFSWVIVARILGSDAYGQFGIVRSTVLMFTSFAGFSLGITASKHVAEFLNTDKQKTGRILGLTMSFGVMMGFAVAVFFYLLSPWLALTTLNAPEVTNELRIGALILFFSSLNGAQMGALQGFMAFKKIATINSIQAIVSFPLFILGAIYWGVYGSIWAFTFSYVFICVLSNRAIRKETKKYFVKIDYSNAWKEKSILLSYSFPAFLSGLMVTPVKWYADSLLVSRGDFQEMGIFTAALTFNNIILVGVSMLSAPFISIMAKNKLDDRNSRFSRFNILAPWALGVFLVSPLLMFPQLGGYVFGSSYAGKSFNLTFSITLLFTVVIMFKQGLSRIMIVYNLQWWSFFSNLLWGVILIISFLLFTEQNSYFLALAYLIAYLINVLIVLPVYYKRKLIPANTIDSVESIAIWFLLILLAIIGLKYNNVLLKAILLVAFNVMYIVLFVKCFKRKSKV